MNERVQWIVHKGKRILFCDYAGLAGDDYVAVIEMARQEILRLPMGSAVCTLNDVTDSTVSPAALRKAQEVENARKQRGIKTIPAVVGMTGMKAALAQFVRKDVYITASLEEAKDWLAAQADRAAKE